MGQTAAFKALPSAFFIYLIYRLDFGGYFKMRTTLLLFIATYLASTLPANASEPCEEVEFTESLTNETGWVYSASYTKFSDENGLYISSKDGTAVISPEYPFAVTSLTITVRHSSDTPQRQLYVFPVVDGLAVSDESLYREITPPNGVTNTAVACSWAKEDDVRAIGFKITGSRGNVYLVSARILGSAIVEPPANVSATKTGGTRVTLSWDNPANTYSNKVYVYRVSHKEESYETVASYTFDEFSNDGGSNKKYTDELVAAYPDFADSEIIYLPANSTGQIQVSSGDNKGVLIHKGFDDTQGLSAAITLKRYYVAGNKDEDRNEMTIGYEESADTTNIIATVSLGNDFKREIVPLDAIPGDMPIIFNADGLKTLHRVIIDDLAFIRNYEPAGNVLEEVSCLSRLTASGCIVSGLQKTTEYVFRITAFNADGQESAPSDDLRLTTTSEGDKGLAITIR